MPLVSNPKHGWERRSLERMILDQCEWREGLSHPRSTEGHEAADLVWGYKVAVHLVVIDNIYIYVCTLYMYMFSMKESGLPQLGRNSRARSASSLDAS